MAEILKDEILSDTELDGVTGGSEAEIVKDDNFLRAIGALNQGESGFGIDQVTRAFAKLGIGYVWYNEREPGSPQGSISNEYYINGKRVTRAEALMKAASKAKAKIDLTTGELMDVTKYL